MKWLITEKLDFVSSFIWALLSDFQSAIKRNKRNQMKPFQPFTLRSIWRCKFQRFSFHLNFKVDLCSRYNYKECNSGYINGSWSWIRSSETSFYSEIGSKTVIFSGEFKRIKTIFYDNKASSLELLLSFEIWVLIFKMIFEFHDSVLPFIVRQFVTNFSANKKGRILRTRWSGIKEK